MSTTHKRAIDGGILTTSVSTGYTTPTSSKFKIHRLSFTNYHAASDATISVYLVPSGATASGRYKVASDHFITNDSTFICYAAEGQVLEEGGTIQYISNVANAITAVCSGVEVTV